ncbi:hypothetical protein ES708_19561 [subsurface metagenome]
MAEYNPVCQFDTADIGFDVGSFDRTMLVDSVAFSTADVIFSSGVKGLAESLNITDDMFVLLFFSETLQIVDSFTRSVTKLFSESLGIADTLVKSGKKLLSESLNIADTFTESVTKLLSESFSIGDIIKFKVLLGEALQVADTLLKSGTKLLSESLSIIDTFTLIEPFVLFFNESLQIVDSITLKSVLKFNEVIKFVDSLVKKVPMIIRKITVRFRGGNYESNIELED